MGGSIVIDWRRKRVKELDRLMCSSRRGLRTKVKGHPLYDAIFFVKIAPATLPLPTSLFPFPRDGQSLTLGGGKFEVTLQICRVAYTALLQTC